MYKRQVLWETVDGAQGGLTSVHTWDTDVAASKFSSFYRDLASPPAGQTPCQGDSGFYGASGPYVNGSIAATDEPANGTAPAARLTSTRTMFFEAPGAANGALRSQQVGSPLSTAVRSSTGAANGGKQAVKLRLRVRYRHGRAGCKRSAAFVTVAGTGLRQVRRAGLKVRSKTVATDRARPFRLKLTRKRLGGHGRAKVKITVRLRSGKRLTLRTTVRGLCRPS